MKTIPPKSVASGVTDYAGEDSAKWMRDRIDNDFVYHPPSGDQLERYAAIREYARGLAKDLVRQCPSSRELSLALTHLEQAVMYANAAIARHEKPVPVKEESTP